MDGWIHGWMGGSMDGPIDGWTDAQGGWRRKQKSLIKSLGLPLWERRVRKCIRDRFQSRW